MRVSIAGGRGFIGSALADRLRAAGHEVLLPDREALRRGAPGGGWGRLVWAAGLTADFRSRPFATVAAHVGDLATLLDRDAARIEGLLYLSSTRVYRGADRTDESAPLQVLPADPSDLYNLTKLAGESLCLVSGATPVKVARLSNVAGPGEAGRQTFLGALCREAASGRIALRDAPTSRKDYLWIDDCADILARFATDDSTGILNVASGRQIAHGDWARAIAARFGAGVTGRDDAPDGGFPTVDTSRLAALYGLPAVDCLSRVAEIAGPGPRTAPLRKDAP